MHKYVKFDQAIPYYHVIIDKSLWRVFLLLTNSFGYYKHTKKKKKQYFMRKEIKMCMLWVSIFVFFLNGYYIVQWIIEFRFKLFSCLWIFFLLSEKETIHRFGSLFSFFNISFPFKKMNKKQKCKYVQYW